MPLPLQFFFTSMTIYLIMKLKVLLTGATGMVGEGVLHKYLQHNQVEKVLVINRSHCDLNHSKPDEIIHDDFLDTSAIAEKMAGYTTCFFCHGVFSVRMKEADYHRLTHTLTLSFAETLVKKKPAMIFCYISGRGTDSTEKGRLMWARVKGKTENDLMKLPFKNAYAFRPGYMHPTKGLKSTLKAYKYVGWLYPFFRNFFPKSVSILKELGIAMILVGLKGYSRNIVEVKDIVSLATENIGLNSNRIK